MYEVLKNSSFNQWLASLRDREARSRILVRIRRLTLGNPGQSRSLKGGISELKIDAGPGYRVYYTIRNGSLILLLCGGDKSSQDNDIQLAIELAKNWET